MWVLVFYKCYFNFLNRFIKVIISFGIRNFYDINKFFFGKKKYIKFDNGILLLLVGLYFRIFFFCYIFNGMLINIYL